MGLFEKKHCEFCGGPIGLLGNKKLADGNMCKDCAAKMSPYLSGRKNWTVADMSEHFEYREANQDRVNMFQITRVLGFEEKLFLDCANAQWCVSRHNNIAQHNADVFGFGQVTGCNIDVKEGRTEIKYRDTEGHYHSFMPAEYEYNYDFYVEIYVNSPFVENIRMKINDKKIDYIDSYEYAQCQTAANNIKYVFDQMMQNTGMITIPDDFVADPMTMAAFREASDYNRERVRALKNYRQGMPMPVARRSTVPYAGPRPSGHHDPVSHGPRPSAPAGSVFGAMIANAAANRNDAPAGPRPSNPAAHSPIASRNTGVRPNAPAGPRPSGHPAGPRPSGHPAGPRPNGPRG